MNQPNFPEPALVVTCSCGCGETFTPKRKHQIYATEKCRKNAYWAKHEVLGVEHTPALDWALAKLAKFKADPNYQALQTLRSRIKE